MAITINKEGSNGPMPVGFVGHGAPTLGMEDNAITQAWRRWALSLPKPKAVLVFSAHWLSDKPLVGPLTPQPLIYDFYGFPEELYRVKYEPAVPEKLIRGTLDLLRSADWNPSPAPERGLDHGAWVPLMKMFPDAGIPRLPGFPSHPSAPLRSSGFGKNSGAPSGRGRLHSGERKRDPQPPAGEFSRPPSRTGGLGERFRRLGSGDVGKGRS